MNQQHISDTKPNPTNSFTNPTTYKPKRDIQIYENIPNVDGKNKFNKLQSYKFIQPNIIDLIKAVSNGPVVVAHFVSKEFKFYTKGIYDGSGCEN